MEIKPGMLARSKAGRDKDCIYVIISVNDEYVYLADGAMRPVCRPKRKKRKHIQPVIRIRDASTTDDEQIRNILERQNSGRMKYVKS